MEAAASFCFMYRPGKEFFSYADPGLRSASVGAKRMSTGHPAPSDEYEAKKLLPTRSQTADTEILQLTLYLVYASVGAKRVSLAHSNRRGG